MVQQSLKFPEKNRSWLIFFFIFQTLFSIKTIFSFVKERLENFLLFLSFLFSLSHVKVTWKVFTKKKKKVTIFSDFEKKGEILFYQTREAPLLKLFSIQTSEW